VLIDCSSGHGWSGSETSIHIVSVYWLCRQATGLCPIFFRYFVHFSHACLQLDALDEALRNNVSLEVHLHLDLNRSTRPGPSSTARVLLPLLRDYPDRMHVSLFRSPKLRGIMAKLVPPRFNEGWGTWHAKIYGVDDEVMISG
jgi:hypothetical protein